MTTDDARWNAYLHERHSRETLREWARSLSFFRFCRAVGGHANDGDCLRAALAVASQAQLEAVFAQLGIALERLPQDHPEPVAGVRYPGTEFMKFVPAARGFGLPVRQPGRVTVAGVEVFAWLRADRLDLSMSDADQPYDVTARTVRDAQAVEALLRPLAGLCIDPPQEGRHCLSPKSHPWLWAGAGDGPR